MAEFYEMPAISPTMEVGSIVEWKIAEGERFESSSIVAEVGTDKANMEAEIFDEGVMLKHLVEEGDEVPPGFPIAIVGTSEDEDISDLLAQFEEKKKELEAGGAPEQPEPETKPAPPREEAPPETAAAEEKPKEAATTAVPAPPKEREWMGKRLPRDFMEPPGDVRAAEVSERVAASPLARKMAEDLGVKLQRVQGTGPGGRIVRADVEQASKAPAAAAGPAPREDEHVRNSPMRKTIARRLLQSHQDIPTFFLTVDLDMEAFVRLREDLKRQLPDVRISYNDMLMMAVARALRDVPQANASWSDKEIVRHGRVDLGMAVALPDGLITPVIRGADGKTLSQIAGETRELAKRAREGKLGEDEYTGATFTISNLGMMDIDHFTAIINPPEVAILAVGALREVPVVEDGALTVGWRMKLTMTCDHRVLDGAIGATFLQALRRYVESPWLLLV